MSDQDNNSDTDPIDDTPANSAHNQDDSQQRKQHMQEQTALQAKIRRHLREGSSKEELFSLLCRDLDLPAATNEQIVDYFENITDFENYHNYENKEHFDLIIKIKAELGKLQTGIATWSAVDDEVTTFEFLDSRYALSFVLCGSDLKLFIRDYYHDDETRELQVDGKIPQVPRPFAFKVNFISFKLLLIFDSSWQRDYFEVHLAYLDLDQGKCTFLDTETVRGPLWSVLSDINDRRKFGMWSIDNSMHTGDLYLAEVTDDSRLIINRSSIKMDEMIRFGRLDGDKLQFLLVDFEDRAEQPEEGKKQPFGECVLVPGRTNPTFNKLFDVQTEKDPRGGCFVKWFGNTCCFIGTMYSNGKGLVYILELDKRHMTSDRALFYGSAKDAYLENDNILTIASVDYESGNMSVQRYALHQPDTLVNLAYLKIRREAIYNGSKLYEQLLPNLPMHLKPFANYPSLQNAQKVLTSETE